MTLCLKSTGRRMDRLRGPLRFLGPAGPRQNLCCSRLPTHGQPPFISLGLHHRVFDHQRHRVAGRKRLPSFANVFRCQREMAARGWLGR